MLNMLEVNNNDVALVSFVNFEYISHLFLFFSVVDFEHVKVFWNTLKL